MLVLAAVTTFIYAGVNAFGTWMVVRRKPWVAAMFMLAACVLIVAFSTMVFALPDAKTILLVGLILASLASFFNAHIVLGNVIWRFHVLRAVIAAAIYMFAHIGLS